jgi:antitoxin HicB
MLAYPLTLEPDDNGTLLVTFPDVPEAVTFGEDETDALRRAVDALETMLAARIADQEDLPLPSHAAGRPCAVLSALATAKVLLYRAMREAGVSNAGLAGRLGWQGAQVERLLDLNHASRLDRIETALAALGKRLDIRMSDAA